MRSWPTAVREDRFIRAAGFFDARSGWVFLCRAGLVLQLPGLFPLPELVAHCLIVAIRLDIHGPKLTTCMFVETFPAMKLRQHTQLLRLAELLGKKDSQRLVSALPDDLHNLRFLVRFLWDGSHDVMEMQVERKPRTVPEFVQVAS